MADFDIERPTVEAQNVQPTYNINPPQFTIEIPGGFQGQRGEKGDTGAPGRDGVDGTNGQDGQDGVSVTSIEQTTTSTESGGTNIITATLSNGDVSTFEIMNGEAGASGIPVLESPVYITDLEDGIYKLPENCLLSDPGVTVTGGGLLSVTHKIVDGEDIASFFVLEDNNQFTVESGNEYPNLLDMKVIYGEVCDNTGDAHYSTVGSVLTSTKIADNLTTNDSTKILSAKQGKILKELISNFDLTPYFSSYETVSDGSYHGSITDGKYNVAKDAYILDDNLVDAYINTEAIMHKDSSNNWGRLDDVLDAKADTSDIPTNTSDLNNDSGFITSETDPVFSASAAAGISSSDISDWNGKQDALVSGTNIKTINNNSLLGSGNITISGGGGTATDVKINGTSIVQNDEADIQTEGTYDASTNKIATMSDIPDTSDFIDKDVNNLTNYSLTTTLQANKSLTKGVEYIVGTQASATNLWTGTSTDTGCSSGTLYTGKVIIYHLPVAGSSSAATLNLTLPDGTKTGAKNVYRLATTTTTTNFAAGCDILMVYDGTNWKVNAYVDTSGSNTIGYQLRTNSALWANKTGYTMNRYTLLFEIDGGLSGAATTIATGTSKTTVAFKYIPGGVIKYYSSSGNIANGSNFTANGLWDQYTCNLGYTFNTGSTLTSGKPVYMRCTVNADGTLSPDYSGTPSHPIVQALPTTADSKVYVYLGQAYSTTNIELMYMHPIYEYKNGKIQLYTGAAGGGGGTITDVQVNSTSVVAGGVADILTESAYDASTNKIATMSDLPTVPTNISSFNNDSGYITGISSGDVTTALGYTPYSSANPNGYTSNTGTITSVKMNGSTVSSSGEADLGTVLTSHQNIKTINSTSLVGTGNVTVQPTLVSGTNIKTINSTSLLGSGDITINGIDELSSAVILDDLSSGIYHLAKGTVLKYKESENDNNPITLTTVNKSALMMFNIKKESGKPLFSYIILQDDHDGTYDALNDDYTLDVGSNSHIMAGCMSPYTGSSWNEGDFNINQALDWNSVVDNLTSNYTYRPLSAKQGKVLKDAIDAITIPTVNDSTITIQKNGTNVDSFTTNASSNKSINITVPTDTNDLTNGAGYITSSSLPTKVSDLTNDTGFITSSYHDSTKQDLIEVIDSQDIDDITSTSNTTYLKIKDLVDNNIPFRISDFDPTEPHTYDVIDTQIYSGNYWISYIEAENKTLRTLKLTKSGSTVTVSYSTKLQLSTTTWIDSLF